MMTRPSMWPGMQPHGQRTLASRMVRFSLATFCTACVIDASAQVLSLAPPGPVLAGDAVAINVRGLPPRARVSVVAERTVLEQGRPVHYRSSADFLAAADGTLDLSRDAPAAGDYQGVDASGLFWSMTPVAGMAPAVSETGLVGLTVLLEQRPVTQGQLRLSATLPLVRADAIAAFPGAIVARLPGRERRPAVIVLEGSMGGATSARALALRLAAHGFVAVALPYYSPELPGHGERELRDLPRSFVDIPVDRLNQVHSWLAGRSDVDSSRIALYGVSKGAEFALIAASKLVWPAAVVAIVPSDVVWQGWGPDVDPPDSRRSSFSFNGVALPFVPNVDFVQELDGFRTGQAVRLRRPMDKGRAAFPGAAAAARIRVEDFKGPMFVAGASDDQMWASAMMAENIAERRLAAGRRTVSLIFQDAGHMLDGSGWDPTTQYNAGLFKLGGTAQGNAHAQAEVWRQALAFLGDALQVAPSQ